MSYQRERDEFIARMSREGLPIDVTRLLLREATGLNRRAELACSSEAADRDRVPCPARTRYGKAVNLDKDDPRWPCLCDRTVENEIEVHTDITRITLQDHRAEARIRRLFTEMDQNLPADAPRWELETQGDPRGYVLRVIPPSYFERNKGRDRYNRDTIGVPCGPSRLRF